MNLQTLISYKEFCFLGRTRAATNGPDESRRAQFSARGWVLAEQTCIARGPPVQTKLACVEVPFPLGVLQDDGALRARHGVLLFAEANIQGLVLSIEGPARAPAGSRDEELAHGDVLALANEPTCKLPANGWDFSQVAGTSCQWLGRPAERTLANSRQKVRRD